MEGMNQGDAATRMNISQPTLNRLLSSARRKVADALKNGKMIRIEGGQYKYIAPRRGYGGGRWRR